MIPGALIALLTFPGIVLHEWAHKKFCDWLGVKVHKVVYFRLNWSGESGYVIHEQPNTYAQTFWISSGPLIVNSFVALGLGFLASQTIQGGWLWWLLMWMAVSAGMHAFPSDHDMDHIQEASSRGLKNGGSILHSLALPLVLLVWIANKLRFFWFDALYAFALVSLASGVWLGNYVAPPSASLPTEMVQMKTQIEANEQQLDTLQGRLSILDNPATYTEYNGLVPTYNKLLSDTKKMIEQYNTKVEEYNKTH
jgi:hypothetical protein